jgi:hypothetical protein
MVDARLAVFGIEGKDILVLVARYEECEIGHVRIYLLTGL